MQENKSEFGDEIYYSYFDVKPEKETVCEVSNQKQEILYYRIMDFEISENGKYKTKMELIGKEKP